MPQTARLLPLIRYLPEQIGSRLLFDDGEADATLFVMDVNESISFEQAAEPRLFVQLDGELRLVDANRWDRRLHAGMAASVPANFGHTLHAVTKNAFIQIQGEIRMETQTFIHKLPQAETIHLGAQIAYAPDQTVSKTLVQRPELGMTLFAIAAGQQIRRHVTAGDALVQVLDGTADIEIGETRHTVSAGQAIVMPAGIPHALYAADAFKMLLVVVKTPARQEDGSR